MKSLNMPQIVLQAKQGLVTNIYRWVKNSLKFLLVLHAQPLPNKCLHFFQKGLKCYIHQKKCSCKHVWNLFSNSNHFHVKELSNLIPLAECNLSTNRKVIVRWHGKREPWLTRLDKTMDVAVEMRENIRHQSLKACSVTVSQNKYEELRLIVPGWC